MSTLQRLTPTPNSRALRRYGSSLLPATFGETAGAAFEDPTLAPAELLGEQQERERAEGTFPEEGTPFMVGPGGVTTLPAPIGEQVVPEADLSPMMSVETLQEDYGHLGLSFDQPMRKRTAELLAEQARAQRLRQDIIARGPRGVAATAGQFGAMLARAAIDPLNIASAFVPVVSQARFAGIAARFGTTRARLLTGAIEGTAGAAIVEPFVYALSKEQQLDYEMSDAIVNVAFGGILGGGLHAVAGRVGDALSRQRPPAREAALRAGVAQMAEGRRVDVEPVFRADAPRPGFESRFADEAGREFDRLFAAAQAAAQTPRARTLAEAPEAQFDIGPATGTGRGQRFADYTRLKHQDREAVRNVVAELMQTRPGRRLFLEAREGEGGAPEVIGEKGDTPLWFQQVNDRIREIQKERKRLTKANARLPVDQRRELPLSESILTRAMVRKVADKLLEGAPLGKAEANVARDIVGAARDFRILNAEDMLRFRQRRQEMRNEELDELVAREGLPERDATADFDTAAQVEAEPVPRAYDDAEAKTEADAVEQELRDMVAQGALPEDALKAIDDTNAAVLPTETYVKGARAAAVCLSRVP